jgi:hypothetical protein
MTRAQLLQRTMATGAGLPGAITVPSSPVLAGLRSAAGGGQANRAAEKRDG